MLFEVFFSPAFFLFFFSLPPKKNNSTQPVRLILLLEKIQHQLVIPRSHISSGNLFCNKKACINDDWTTYNIYIYISVYNPPPSETHGFSQRPALIPRGGRTRWYVEGMGVGWGWPFIDPFGAEVWGGLSRKYLHPTRWGTTWETSVELFKQFRLGHWCIPGRLFQKGHK